VKCYLLLKKFTSVSNIQIVKCYLHWKNSLMTISNERWEQ
jgi:hypothetical protein